MNGNEKDNEKDFTAHPVPKALKYIYTQNKQINKKIYILKTVHLQNHLSFTENQIPELRFYINISIDKLYLFHSHLKFKFTKKLRNNNIFQWSNRRELKMEISLWIEDWIA